MNAPITEVRTYTQNASPFSAWSWLIKSSPETIAEYLDEEINEAQPEEFKTCLAALLALAED